MAESWRLNGNVLVACNCDWGCPCNFNAPPTTGKCEGGWTWHVEEGAYGDIALDGLNFSVYANWPGAIHEGNGEALILIDARADTAQRAAIEVLLGGKAGGLHTTPGQHIKADGRHPVEVVNTAMKAVGVDKPLGEVSGTFDELFK